MTETQYKTRVTIAVPEALIEPANHLACLLGEGAGDIDTFRGVTHQDASGNRYAVVSTPVKAVFLEPTQTGTLPETPEHGIDLIDRAKAEQAFATLNQADGLQMRAGMSREAAVADIGLKPIP